jgi:hypothetical protein
MHAPRQSESERYASFKGHFKRLSHRAKPSSFDSQLGTSLFTVLITGGVRCVCGSRSSEGGLLRSVDSLVEDALELGPAPRRRGRLPPPKEVEQSISLWSLIKSMIGKDLTRVCLPVYFNEPISALQKVR